jgi:hypothetical protein
MYNNMWNAANYPGTTQTLAVCNFNSFYVTANMNNNANDGAGRVVVHEHPQRFRRVRPACRDLRVRLRHPVEQPGRRVDDLERQLQPGPAPPVANVTIDGHAWTLWNTNGYHAFVADQNFTSGSLNLLSYMQYLIQHGYMAATSTVGQVNYGAELVSTNSTNRTFFFDNFDVNVT